MRRLVAAGLFALVPGLLMPAVAHAQAEQQEVVDRAALTTQFLANDRNGRDAQAVLRQARAVMICPQVFRAGFLFGGQGGTCVLSARDAAGSWSSPAFYGLGGASFGFQAGIQDAEVMFFIMNDRGMRAIMDSQLKLGVDAAATFVDIGGGVEGATSTALQADIVGFSRARGVYAGISLGGSLLSFKSDWNAAYYGRPVGPQDILVTMQANNPGADPLRTVLTRYGTQGPATAAALPPPQAAAYPLQPPPGAYVPPQPAAVQRQTLPPPPRR